MPWTKTIILNPGVLLRGGQGARLSFSEQAPLPPVKLVASRCDIARLHITRKLCYRKDDRAMCAMSRCGDMAIRNYPRWRRPPS